MSSKPIFKVIFYNQGDIYEIYARQIYQSEIYGFIEVEELIFGENIGFRLDGRLTRSHGNSKSGNSHKLIHQCPNTKEELGTECGRKDL